MPLPAASLARVAEELELGDRQELLLGMRLSSMRKWLAEIQRHARSHDVRRNTYAGPLASTRIEELLTGPEQWSRGNLGERRGRVPRPGAGTTSRP